MRQVVSVDGVDVDVVDGVDGLEIVRFAIYRGCFVWVFGLMHTVGEWLLMRVGGVLGCVWYR